MNAETRIRGVLSYANVVATLALFIALGGGAYAAATLPANSIGAKQLRNGAVTPPKVSPAAVRLFKGRRGVPGSLGPQGPQGPQGPPGTSGTIANAKAGGDLVGSYPNPHLADGAVNTSSFAATAVAPNATELGGQPATDYVRVGNPSATSAVPILASGYYMNTGSSSDYSFGAVVIHTIGTAGDFEVCSPAGGSETETYAVAVAGVRSAGTLPAGACTTPFKAGGDFSVSMRRVIIFGVAAGSDPTDQYNDDLFGFSQP